MKIRNSQQYNLLPQLRQVQASQQLQTFSKYTSNDKVSFGNNPIKIILANNPKSINSLVDLFYKSIYEDILKTTNKKSNFLEKLIDKYAYKLQTIPFRVLAKNPNSINEIIEQNGKKLGGYSFTMNHKTKSAHINLLTITPEIKRTKTSIKTLKLMANRIYTNAKLNKMEYLTWTTSKNNTQAMRLFSRLNPQQTKIYLNREYEYKIDLEKFKSTIDKY